MKNKIKEMHSIDDLSNHLFWDVDKSKISWEKNKLFLVQRILEFGKDKDWQLLKAVYGIDKIAKIATQLRTLDDISLNFISKISDTPLEKFRCYKLKQSHPNYIDY